MLIGASKTLGIYNHLAIFGHPGGKFVQRCYQFGIVKGGPKKPNENAQQFLRNFSGYKHARRLGHN